MNFVHQLIGFGSFWSYQCIFWYQGVNEILFIYLFLNKGQEAENSKPSENTIIMFENISL